MQQIRFIAKVVFQTCITVTLSLALWTGFKYLTGQGGSAEFSSFSHEPSSAGKGADKLADKLADKNTDEPGGRDLILSDSRTADKDHEQANMLLNDPAILGSNWGLQKTDAGQAWKVEQGSKDIVVAIIDTGIDAHHKNLEDNLWVNPGESGKDAKGRDKASNGIDDDANGYIDDIHGWNFVANNNDLTDNHGHGTHIAGIIGANGKGGGVAGVAPRVSLMVLKYYDPKGPGSNNLKNTVQAIRYATQMKAHIINYSGGGTDYSPEEQQAVREAGEGGLLFIAAAGNERSNSDEKGKHYYPADYGLPHIISVTAVNKQENVLPSSNYGVRTVDIAAPGENIYSTLPGNHYGLLTGTSQATAFVTGVTALVMAHNRDLKPIDVKHYILRTGDEYATLLSKTGNARLLNSYKALTKMDLGTSATGVKVSNTSGMSPRAFAASQEDREDPSMAPGALGQNGGAESAENMAQFGRSFVRAVEKQGARPEPK